MIKYPLSVKSGKGHAYTFKDAYIEKKYQNPERTQLNFVRHLDNQTIAMVHDDTQVTIQSIELDGSHVGERSWTKNFNFKGAKVLCEDIIFNPERDLIYVGCIDKRTEPGVDKALWIWQIDMQDPESVHYTKVQSKQLEDWWPKNRIQLGLFNLPQESSNTKENKGESLFLLVWDQGVSIHDQTKDINHNFLAFVGIEAGDVTFDFRYQIYSDFDAIYDLLNYQGKILLSGKGPATNGLISVKQCEITRGIEEVECRTKAVPTKASKGFIGFFNTGQFFVFDREKRTVSIHNLVLPFGKDNWLGEPAYEYQNVPISEDPNQWVRRFEGNSNHGILHWTMIGGVDSAVVVVSRRLHVEPGWIEDGASGAILNNVFVKVKGDHLMLQRLGAPFFYAEADRDLTPGENKFDVEVTDKEGSVKGQLDITVLSDPWAPVEFTQNLPYMDVFEGSFFQLPFSDFDLISGNGVHYDLKFSKEAEGIVEPAVLNEYSVNLIYNPPQPQNLKFQVFNLVAGHIIAQSYGNQLYYFQCHSDKVRELTCKKELLVQLRDTTEFLQQQVSAHHGVAFAYTLSKNSSDPSQKNGQKTVAYFFSKSQGYTRFELPELATSAVMLNDGLGELLAAFAFPGRVEVYALNPHDHSEWELRHKITIKEVQEEFWCPEILRTDPTEPHMIHVLSSCLAQNDQRIVQLTFDKFFSRNNSVAINSKTLSPDFCPMGDEYIIWSLSLNKIYAVNEEEDIALYEIPTSNKDGLRLQEIISVECNSDIQQFTVVAKGSEDNERNLGVFWGNRHQKASLRLQHFIPDVEADNVRSFASFHGSLHAIFGAEGAMRLLQTNIEGPVLTADVLFAEHTEEDMEVTMTVTGENQHFNNKVEHKVVLRKPNTNLKIEIIGTPDDDRSSFDLEQFVKIEGPVFHTTLSGSDEVILKERAEQTDAVHTEETPEFQFTYDLFKTHDEFSIGIRNDEFLTSTIGFITKQNQLNSVTYGNAILSFDFDVWDWSKFFTVTSTTNHEGSRNFLEAFVWDTTQKKRTKVHDSQFEVQCDKLQLAKISKERYLIFCHELHRERIEMIEARISTSIEFTTRGYVEGVWWWDLAVQNDHIYLYYTKNEGSQLYGLTVSRNPNLNVNHLKPYKFEEMPYRLGGVAAAAESGERNMLAISTQGTRIFDCVSPLSGDEVSLECLKLDKYRSYEGFELVIDPDYIIQHASTIRTGDSAVLIWKRQDKDSKGQLYYGIDLGGAAKLRAPQISSYKKRNVMKNERGRLELEMSNYGRISSPVTIARTWDNTSVITVPTGSVKEPAKIYGIGHFEVIIPADKKIDFTRVFIEFEGQGPTKPLVLDDVVHNGGGGGGGGDDPKEGTFQWWPFALIILVLLLLALGWFVYGRTKGSTEERTTYGVADANYLSLGDGNKTLVKRTEYEEEDLDEERVYPKIEADDNDEEKVHPEIEADDKDEELIIVGKDGI